jgi:hypothetical protein
MAQEKAASEKQLYFVGILAWLIPGAGHWILGLRNRAVIMFFAVCSTFVLGLALGSIELIDPSGAKAWFCGQILCGLPAIVSTFLQNPGTSVSGIYGRGVDLGQLYTGMAGLLNLLCILDALFKTHLLTRAGEVNPRKR